MARPHSKILAVPEPDADWKTGNAVGRSALKLDDQALSLPKVGAFKKLLEPGEGTFELGIEGRASFRLADKASGVASKAAPSLLDPNDREFGIVKFLDLLEMGGTAIGIGSVEIANHGPFIPVGPAPLEEVKNGAFVVEKA